jgi:hypothetical protein
VLELLIGIAAIVGLIGIAAAYPWIIAIGFWITTLIWPIDD